MTGTAIHPLGVPLKPQNLKRGKNRYSPDYTKKALYKFYQKSVSESMHVESSEIFYKLIDSFHEKVVARILKGESFKIPHFSGEIRIMKYTKGRGSSLPIDYKRSYELGFRVAHINEDRNGAIYRWRWIKPKKVHRIKPFIQYYSFIACRTAKRLVKPALTENPSLDFYEYKFFNSYK